jgi:hypothetical protein
VDADEDQPLLFWFWEIPLAYVPRCARGWPARRLHRDHGRVFDDRGRRRPRLRRGRGKRRRFRLRAYAPGVPEGVQRRFLRREVSRYAADLEKRAGSPCDFRLAETPVFLTEDLEGSS